MIFYHCLTLILTWVTVYAVPADVAPTCTYKDQRFSVGEHVTLVPCDDCLCTQFGFMCQLRQCPLVACVDQVRGECCNECPNGINCLYVGDRGNATVPEDGCRYSDSKACYCELDQQTRTTSVFCVPPFPMDQLPGCDFASR